MFFGGCIGELDAGISFEQLSSKLAGILEEPVRSNRNHDRTNKKICVAAGGGNMTTEMKIAADLDCDAYITGEYVLYSQQFARIAEMNLFVGSHTNTEILGVRSLAKRLALGTDLKVERIPESND